MSKIILDQETINKLGGITETTVLCDEQGNVIGVMGPSTARQLEPQISEEELRRRINNPGRRYTTEEVLKHLLCL